MHDYAGTEQRMMGKDIHSHEWAAAIIPGIIGFIAAVVIALCLNVLYKIFKENILTSINEYQINNSKNVVVNNNSMSTIPNITQNQVVITGNSVGVIPPMVENPKTYPVNIQSGTNLNA